MAVIYSALTPRWQRMLAIGVLAALIAFALVVSLFEFVTDDFEGALQAAPFYAVVAGIAAALIALIPDEARAIRRAVQILLLLVALGLWQWWILPPSLLVSWLPDNACWSVLPTIGPGSLANPDVPRCAAQSKAHYGWIAVALAVLLASAPRRANVTAWLAIGVAGALLVALTVNLAWIQEPYFATVLLWILLAVGLVILPVAGLMLFPAYLASFVLTKYTTPDKEGPTRTELIEVQNSMRTTVVQLLGGVVLLATVFFTWQQVGLGRQSQITERFTRAIDQLGNADSVDVRMGGIHGLRRIANDSPSDQDAISDILSQYVRERAPRGRKPILKATAAELRAALVALSDLEVIVDISRTDLSDVRLPNTNFGESNLSQSILRGMDLEGARLSGADLSGSDLSETNLNDADLSDVLLVGSVLTKTNLISANLEGAVLDGADLRLVEGLETATLDGAHATKATTWPSGFNPEEHGVTVS